MVGQVLKLIQFYFFILTGLDPDVRDAFHRSPLHCAAYGGHINCMNLLLENKANVDLQDQEVRFKLRFKSDRDGLQSMYSIFSHVLQTAPFFLIFRLERNSEYF